MGARRNRAGLSRQAAERRRNSPANEFGPASTMSTSTRSPIAASPKKWTDCSQGDLPSHWPGKSPWLQSVHFFGEAAIGDLVEVDIVEAGPNSLAGELRLRSAA